MKDTPTGLFALFTLTKSPAVFQAFINDVLGDFLNVFVFAYLNDILIFSRSKKKPKLHVFQVLQRMLENKLYVKA